MGSLNNGIASITVVIRDRHEMHVIDFVNKQGNVEKRLEAAKDADIKRLCKKYNTRICNYIRFYYSIPVSGF